MTDVKLQKLKASLAEAMQKWIDDKCSSEDWEGLDTHTSDFVPELMADSAFNILLAQSDLTTYYTDNDMMKS